MTRAIAPVAAEIIAGRPPRKAMDTAMMKEAYNPTRGSTPAMRENAIASGIRAKATTRPDSTSARICAGRGSLASTDRAEDFKNRFIEHIRNRAAHGGPQRAEARSPTMADAQPTSPAPRG